MTTIEFDLRDFSGFAWDAGTVPELTFRPSTPGVDAWGVYASDVTVPGTRGAVDLVPTTAMQGLFYSLELSWIEGGQSRREFWPHKIRVPEMGPVALFDVVDLRVPDLYQLVEVSEGTVIEGLPVPHSAQTKIWLKLGADSGIYMEVE